MSEFEVFCHENNLKVIIDNSLRTMPKGFCYYYDDQFYVILNSKHSYEQLQRTTIHEIIHILEDHFSLPVNQVDVCEKQVNSLIDKLYSNFILEFEYA